MKISQENRRPTAAEALAAQASATSLAAPVFPPTKAATLINHQIPGLGFVAGTPSANFYLYYDRAPKTRAEAQAFKATNSLAFRILAQAGPGAPAPEEVQSAITGLHLNPIAWAAIGKVESPPKAPGLVLNSLAFGDVGKLAEQNRFGVLSGRTVIPGLDGIKVGGGTLTYAAQAPHLDQAGKGLADNIQGLVVGERAWIDSRMEEKKRQEEAVGGFRDLLDLAADVSPVAEVCSDGVELALDGLELYQHRDELRAGDREAIGLAMSTGGVLIAIIPTAASLFGFHMGLLGHIMTVGGAALSATGSVVAGKFPELGVVAKLLGIPDNVTFMTRLQLIQARPVFQAYLAQNQNLSRDYSRSFRAACA